MSLPFEPLFALDTPQPVSISPRESYLKGWFVPPAGVNDWSLVVLVDGKEHQVYTGFPRPDVKKHLGGMTGGRSGFIARMATPAPGSRISLAARWNGELRELVADIPQEQSQTSRENHANQRKFSSYQDWLIDSEPKILPKDDDIPTLLDGLLYRPRFSLLVEFREYHPYFAEMFVRSLSAQLYPDWQLCLFGNGAADSLSFRQIENWAATDSRVKLLPVSDPSEAWNTALHAADGEFVAELRLCDEFHPAALLQLARSLQGNNADILYTDEDRMDLFGKRSRPQFKPVFNSEHFLAVNYLGKLSAVRRTLALQSGGFRPLPAEAREWDFLLRCVEQTRPDRIVHVAQPVYHLRTREALANAGINLPLAQSDDFCHVIRDHIARTGKRAVAQIGFPTDTIRLQYQSPPEVSLSIFLRDEDGVFQVAALNELVHQRRVDFFGVLNGIVHRLPDSKPGPAPVFRSPLVSFAEITGDVLLFINRPINSLNHFFLRELAAQAIRPDCGLVTGLAVSLSGQFIHTGLIEESAGRYVDPFAGIDSRRKGLGRHVRVMRSVAAISDEFFAVRREHVEAIGGLEHLSSARMPFFIRTLIEHVHRQGLQVIVTPDAVGTFDCSGQAPSASEVMSLSERAALLNPNLSAFADPYLLLETEDSGEAV